MKLKPAGLRGSRPKSAPPRRKKAPAGSPAKAPARDGRAAIEALETKGSEDNLKLSEECKQILRGGYTLNDKQQDIYEDFTEMSACGVRFWCFPDVLLGRLADFDLYMMVNILEDALKDAQKKTMLSDYTHVV